MMEGVEKPEAALVSAEEGHRLLESLGGPRRGRIAGRLVLAESLAAVGRQAEANKAIADARLLARAAPALRKGFLEGVAANVRALSLAAQWAAG